MKRFVSKRLLAAVVSALIMMSSGVVLADETAETIPEEVAEESEDVTTESEETLEETETIPSESEETSEGIIEEVEESLVTDEAMDVAAVSSLSINVDEALINRYFIANVEESDLTSVFNGQTSISPNVVSSLDHADYHQYTDLASGDHYLCEVNQNYILNDDSLFDTSTPLRVFVNGEELECLSNSNNYRHYGNNVIRHSPAYYKYPALTITVSISRDQLDPSMRYLSISFGSLHGTVDMYRLYNPNSGEHFYTSSEGERDVLINAGWRYEGLGWRAPSFSNTPVYRLYNENGGEHHYTTSVAERDMLVSLGWNDEGIGWYSDDAQTVPLYRQYNPNAFANNHNYTTSLGENDWLVSIGWRAEGIGWYGVG